MRAQALFTLAIFLLGIFALVVELESRTLTVPPCERVRELVQVYGREHLESMAKSRGFTVDQIREASKCLTRGEQ